MKGVSIIICCYNSATRIIETLHHIAKQKISDEAVCELIVVDNASNDNTSEVVLNAWKQYREASIEFRLLNQPLPGLSNARKMGIENANYDIVIFCDDDNHLMPDYIDCAMTLMGKMPEVGIIGGLSKPKLAFYPGKWIEDMYPAMAIGPIDINDGYVEWVYGAGMVLRKNIIKELKDKHIDFLLSDRSGSAQTFGGDAELCELAKFLGYKIYYSASLVFYHYMQEHRLKKSFFKEGYTTIIPSVYLYVLAHVVKSTHNSIYVNKLYTLFLKQRIRQLFYFFPRQLMGKHRFYSSLSFYQAWLLFVWLTFHKKEFYNIYNEVINNLIGRKINSKV